MKLISMSLVSKNRHTDYSEKAPIPFSKTGQPEDWQELTLTVYPPTFAWLEFNEMGPTPQLAVYRVRPYISFVSGKLSLNTSVVTAAAMLRSNVVVRPFQFALSLAGCRYYEVHRSSIGALRSCQRSELGNRRYKILASVFGNGKITRDFWYFHLCNAPPGRSMQCFFTLWTNNLRLGFYIKIDAGL